MKSPKHRPSAFDWAWATISWIASAYLIRDHTRLDHRWEGASPVLPGEVVLGAIMAILVIEACRRSLSPWMAVTISLSLVYLATSQWIPGIFNFKGYSFPRMVEFVYLAGDEGMYGFLTGISTPDPVTGAPRSFNDLARRNQDLKQLVCGEAPAPAPRARATGGARAARDSASRSDLLVRGIGRVH